MASLGMNGPYNFSKEEVTSIVNSERKGNYALGEVKDGVFIVKYVGRSDDRPLRERILEHLNDSLINEYKQFKFIYEDDAKKRFDIECKNFHDFGGSDRLFNKIHPAKPKELNVECEYCLDELFKSILEKYNK